MRHAIIGAALGLSVGGAAFAQAPAPATAVPAPPPTAAELPPTPATDEEWQAAARRDVLAAYDIFAANHPGMHDPANPGFPAQLARARDRALAAAARAAGRRAYEQALGAFSAELSDGHALIFPKPVQGANTPVREWPGFVAAWRGRRAYVHRAEPDSPAPAGAEIVACNGMPIADFLRARLLTRGFRPSEPGHWWLRAPNGFISTSATREGRPERCRFRIGRRRRVEAPLAWRAAPEDLDAQIALASDGERTPIGLSEPRPGLFLIGMPDFNPSQAGIEAYRALYGELGRRRPELLAARALVIDLRHNNGGSSLWSRDAARILWGREAVERRMADYFRNVSIWWRASPGNTDYMEQLVTSFAAQGRAQQAEANRGPAEGMRAALSRGEPFFVQQLRRPDAAPPAGPPPATDFRVPVYVITPGRCASACLDALDAFTRFDNTSLIGAPTSADSTYMEVRNMDLPSGLGRIVIPNKMWSGRPRASGEVYRPRIELNDLDWSTGTFLDRIEQDLAARPRPRRPEPVR